MGRLKLKRHTLQFRVLLFFLLLGIILTGMLSVAGLLNNGRINSLYNSRVGEERADFEARLDDKSALSQAMVADYSVWDDTYDYLLGNLPDYPDLNISEDSLGTFSSDVIWLYKSDFSLATKLSLIDDSPDLANQKQKLQQLFSQSYAVHFYLPMQEGLLEIFGSTVVHSDDYEHTDKPAGYLFVGRRITNDTLSALKSKNISSVQFVSPKSISNYPAKLPAGEGIIAFSIAKQDINDKTVGYIYVRYKASVLREMDLLGMRLLWLNGVMFLGLLIVSYIAIWKAVVKPLNTVRSSLETTDTSGLKNIMNEHTEFGRIALLIDNFFKQEKMVEIEIKEKRVLLDQLTASNTEVAETNRVMIGRELKMIELKKQIAELSKDKKTEEGNDGKS